MSWRTLAEMSKSFFLQTLHVNIEIKYHKIQGSRLKVPIYITEKCNYRKQRVCWVVGRYIYSMYVRKLLTLPWSVWPGFCWILINPQPFCPRSHAVQPPVDVLDIVECSCCSAWRFGAGRCTSSCCATVCYWASWCHLASCCWACYCWASCCLANCYWANCCWACCYWANWCCASYCWASCC